MQSRLVWLDGGWLGAGRLTELHFGEVLDFCGSYWAKVPASAHFSDLHGIAITIHIGGLFSKDFEATTFKGKAGLYKLGLGRSLPRYTASIYVPVEAWSDKQPGDPATSGFLADSFRQTFDAVLTRASRVKGRLLQPARDAWHLCRGRACVPG